jgi:5-methylthioadenosine/S-adenosylhomocysteine deaminase
MDVPILLCPEFVLRSHQHDPEPDTAVLVAANKIVGIGPAGDLLRCEPSARRIDLPRSMLMPGFVNAHQHGRGLSQIQLGYPDQRLELWMAQRRARGNPDLHAIGLLASAELLRNGVTCAIHADLAYGTGDYEAELRASIAAYDEAGLRACVAVGVCDRGNIVFPQCDERRFLDGLPGEMRLLLEARNDPPYAPDWPATLALMDRLMDAFAGNDRIGFCYGPSGPQWVTDDLFRRASADADRRGIGLHIHALETIAQYEACRRLYPLGTMRHLRTLGALGPRTVIAHGVFLSDDDIAILAQEGASVATNPGSNIRLCDGIAPVAELVARGIRVGVGTDNSSVMDDEDLFSEARIAASLTVRRRWSSPPKPTGAQTIRMLTESGAAMAGFGGRAGRIDVGWCADLTAVSLDRTRGVYLDADMPLVDALVARARGSDVRLTMVDGRILYHNGSFERLDISAIRHDAAAAAARARRPENPAAAELATGLRPYLADFYRQMTASSNGPPAPVSS